ncbi:uncharacterized protein EDB91DRAFT_1243837 [Suillus paluster]|uniref:uncharacterized protein n=1 Tax=Suillus paluster TaxID=48578 RepID=UPI001B879EF6|nr:uncharacterized protein EDB91DRAFT_1243837 [Suillus paluster]KAG1751591.1 hypothetical protein EDB91DRAFT_1243837 [Suillus paluster]
MASAKAKHSQSPKRKQASPKGRNQKQKAVSSDSESETSESESEPKCTSKKKPQGPVKSKRARRNMIDKTVHESEASEEVIEIEPLVGDAEDEETKAAFLGLTAHWIERNDTSGNWTLVSQVIGFRGISAAHGGYNLAWYLVGLYERVGIINGQSSKLFCVTADNTSNNDTTCNNIEILLHHRHMYNFNPTQHCLPCLAHVVNLSITDVMSVVTCIANIETTTAIWEFDPSLPNNRVLGDLLDVVVAVCTLVIKIQSSAQHIEYFETLQVKCSILTPLKIPLHSNAINLFISSADELFGPITSIRCHGKVIKHIPWTAFTLRTSDWGQTFRMLMIYNNTSPLNDNQHYGFALYKEAIQKGLAKIGKYYSKLDDKPVYVLALILHPYYKLAYIAMAWGSPEEQAKEQAAGNLNTKNWYDEALKVVKTMMEEYWAAHKPLTNTVNCDSTVEIVETIESEYDRHCHMLVQQTIEEQNSGWVAELCHYLKDMPENNEYFEGYRPDQEPGPSEPPEPPRTPTPPPHAPTPPPSVRKMGEISLNKPAIFDRSPKLAKSWWTSVTTYIAINDAIYDTDAKCIAFATLFMQKGHAL